MYPCCLPGILRACTCNRKKDSLLDRLKEMKIMLHYTILY